MLKMYANAPFISTLTVQRIFNADSVKHCDLMFIECDLLFKLFNYNFTKHLNLLYFLKFK